MAATTIDVDRISQLPDHIIHHILSFLPIIEVVRVSVLSKTWNGFFSCFPISDFSELSFPSKVSEWNLKFANFVYSSLLRQCLHDTSIPKFYLSVGRKFFDDNLTSPQLVHESSDIINQSIRLSAQYGVKELSIYFYLSEKYRLPETIFSAKELVACSLFNCSLDSSINCPSLRKLSLEHVDICERRIIDNLIFTCPLLEKFALLDCQGIDYLKLLGFKKLKKVKIGAYLRRLEKIEIDALSLQSFSFRGRWNKEKAQFDLTPCKNLEVLKFSGMYGDKTYQTIGSLITNFPALKLLYLFGIGCKEIEISSLQLEKLQIYTEKDVEAIIINAPKLQSFRYKFQTLPSFFSINKLSLNEVSLEIFLSQLYNEYDTDFLKYLAEYLGNFGQIELVTLKISYYAKDEFLSFLRYISHPIFLDFNHLELEIDVTGVRAGIKFSEDNAALVDWLFRMCHPHSLSLMSGWAANGEFIKDFYKKICSYIVKDQHCCAMTDVKRCQHDLKGIKVKYCGRNGDSKILTCDAFLDSLQSLEPFANICFLFEW